MNQLNLYRFRLRFDAALLKKDIPSPLDSFWFQLIGHAEIHHWLGGEEDFETLRAGLREIGFEMSTIRAFPFSKGTQIED